MEGILVIGSLLASTAAFAAFVLGVTKTARLRRREQTLRESLSVFEAAGPHRRMLEELHKATVAELVARQLTSPWRSIFPWVAWAGLTATWAQTGFYAARYVGSEVGFSWSGFVTEVAIDPAAALFGVVAMPYIAYEIFASQVYTLSGRAETMRSFFDGESVGRPETFSDAQVRAEVAAMKTARAEKSKAGESIAAEPGVEKPKLTAKEAARNAASFLLGLVPGVFVTSLGLFIGMMVWVSSDEGEQAKTGALYPLSYVVMPLLFLSSMAMSFLVMEVRAEIRSHALPTSHTAGSGGSSGSGLWVPPRRQRGPRSPVVQESDG